MNELNKRPTPEPHAISPDHPEVPDEIVESGTDLGFVQIHNSVIAAIARVAALKIPGVVEMSGGLVDGLAGMIGKKSADRGIRVEHEDSTVSLELHVVLEFGARIPHVAWQIQTEVRSAVEKMTGKPVKAVNVIVQGVRLPAEEKPAGREILPA
jgi:uncharacterized alkaline shock family protein YloU